MSEAGEGQTCTDFTAYCFKPFACVKNEEGLIFFTLMNKGRYAEGSNQQTI